MKIKIISDLHIDHNHDYKTETKFDDVFTIVAGDISQTNDYPKEAYLKQIKKGIWVAGNHDYWNKTDVDSAVAKWSKQYSIRSNLTFLENNYKIINNVVFIGCTLWTDFNLYHNRDLATTVVSNWPDFKYNHVVDHGKLRLMNPNDMIGRFNESVKFIENTLSKFNNNVCVLITHFVPTNLGVANKYKNNSATPFFASDLDYLFHKHPNIKLFIFGHTHECFKVKCGEAIGLCNPRGYIYAQEGYKFQPNLMIDLNEETGRVTTLSNPKDKDILPGTYECLVTKDKTKNNWYEFKTIDGRKLDLPARYGMTYELVKKGDIVNVHVGIDWSDHKMIIIDLSKKTKHKN